MKRYIVGLAALAVAWVALPAMADWLPGDDHKMHYPQLPDPNGWDIEIFTAQHEIADDWQCSETGFVEDIHFWTSWTLDDVGIIDEITATIYSNVPAVPGSTPSHPGQPLWSQPFTQFTVRDEDRYGTGNQGFADPQYNDWRPFDHIQFQQINIEDIQNPFRQTEGEIYWLGLSADWFTGIQSPVGWKTTGTVFQDIAVYRDLTGAWVPLIDPFQRPLDLAFVITGGPGIIPEPSTFVLLSLGAVGLLASARRRRRRR